MDKQKIEPPDGGGRETEEFKSVWSNWPQPPSFESKEADVPSLTMPGARTIVRDRWERLVTVHDIPASVETTWHALTDPAALGEWFAACHGSLEQLHRDCILDFEDGEFFLCRTQVVRPPHYLQYCWRWMGIGPIWRVTWQLEARDAGTHVTAIEEGFNPPSRWQHWNGEGWPGILDQLAIYTRTGIPCRWPWRREAYALTELAVPLYEAWDRLFSPPGLKYWLLPLSGTLLAGQTMQIQMGDASGTVEMLVHEIVQPSFRFYPYVTFSMRRSVWNAEVPGRLFMEPAGWGRSVLQMFQYGWENLPPALQRSEREVLAGFWAAAMQRASIRCGGLEALALPHVAGNGAKRGH